MISFEQAYARVMAHVRNFGTVTVPLEQAYGRTLAEAVRTDRNNPPFDRATKDGIAITSRAVEQGLTQFRVVGTIAAGTPRRTLTTETDCWEIMTGAVVPERTGAVVMYEHLQIDDGRAMVTVTPRAGQNIHRRGSDYPMGSLIMEPGQGIGVAELGALATVGQAEVLVRQRPTVAVISTGDELVDVTQTPQPYQIRRSNAYLLQGALRARGIGAALYHLPDEQATITAALQEWLATYDVLLLSGGVSRGKYDYLPEALEALGVASVFHRVAQRPGKPLWFGTQAQTRTTVFAFPGNPVSTAACFATYFVPWLSASTSTEYTPSDVLLDVPWVNDTELTHLIAARTEAQGARRVALPVSGNGSGDLLSLIGTHGFLLVPPATYYPAGAVVRFFPYS